MLVRNSNESKAWLRSVYDLQYDELRLKEVTVAAALMLT